MAGTNLNTVALVGNLTRDPELRTTGSGVSVCDFSIAVNERIKKGGEWQDHVSFFDIVAWAGLGENVAKYMTKGNPVAVTGKLRQERWQKDGQNRSAIRIQADGVQFLNRSERQGGGQGQNGGQRDGEMPGFDDEPPRQQQPAQSGGSWADDIPF